MKKLFFEIAKNRYTCCCSCCTTTIIIQWLKKNKEKNIGNWEIFSKKFNKRRKTYIRRNTLRSVTFATHQQKPNDQTHQQNTTAACAEHAEDDGEERRVRRRRVTHLRAGRHDVDVGVGGGLGDRHGGRRCLAFQRRGRVGCRRHVCRCCGHARASWSYTRGAGDIWRSCTRTHTNE